MIPPSMRRLAGLVAVGLVLSSGLWLKPSSAQSLDSATPESTPTPYYAPTATPPTQGGNGANIFYVYCMPCHGDKGQGLTDEFRQTQYPPDDANCWNSGCHGNRPYDGGFVLPKTVPALIGPDTLQRFSNAAKLYDFIRAAMPFNDPGALTSTEYMQLTVFLLEQNQLVPEGAQLDPVSAANVPLGGAPLDSPVDSSGSSASDGGPPLLLTVGAFAVVGVVLFAATRRRSR